MINDPVSVEVLILANHVEAINNLLYVSGGGWTAHARRNVPGGSPSMSHLGIGVMVAIPWNETNRPHGVTIEIRDEDAGTALASVNAKLTAGRPPTLSPGATQHCPIGLAVDTVFPHAGEYVLVARADGNDDKEKRWSFQVIDA